MKMKKLLFLAISLLSFVFFPLSLKSQTIPPPYINYQAVLYDVNGANPNNPLINQSFSTFVNINDELGNLLYREEHYASTDANGLITVKMGDGLYTAGPITNFNQINWGVGKYYLVVDFDINGTISSTAPEQLVTVPYSFYAGNAGNGMSSVIDNGDGTLTFTYANGATYITPILSGVTGTQGPVGPAGATGIQGPMGPQGPAGNDGLDGATGPQGIQGLTGAVGATGPTGPQGIQGVAGTNGMNGAVGAQGPIGFTGPAGPQGIQGPAGNDGSTGPQGPIGLTGAQGSQGIQGVAGTNGANGANGATGTQGPQGVSGTNGLNALIKTTTEPIGVNCASGGTKIETGLDANGNGILDAAEINAVQTKYVCDGFGSSGAIPFSNFQVYSTPGSYNWTCPVGITKIMVECWGAGGGGCSQTQYSYSSAGGGGGGYAKSILYVNSGTTYTVVVGSGGVAVTGVSNVNGNNGGNSSFNGVVIGNGGGGGNSTDWGMGTNVRATGGSGVGQIVRSGGNYFVVYNNSDGMTAYFYGYAPNSSLGTPPAFPGGGGANNGNGANGQVIITY